MADQGPDYTLRRPVDINQPLPIIFHQDDNDLDGYFIQEDGMASKNRPAPAPGSKKGKDVPVPVVSLINEGVEVAKFPRPTHLMVSQRLDTDYGQTVEYDANSDDEDFVSTVNRLVPPKQTNRALTPEILECYLDFFEKTYLFSKGASKLPVKNALLRKHSLQRCLICDYSDPDRAVLECRSCGILVHSACYHDILYSASANAGVWPSTSPNHSQSPAFLNSTDPSTQNDTKTTTTKTKKAQRTTSTSTPARSSRGKASAPQMDVDPQLDSNNEEEEEQIAKKTVQRPIAAPVAKRASRPTEANIKQEDGMDVSDEEQTDSKALFAAHAMSFSPSELSISPAASQLLDVYRAPFVDLVHEDGSWWCAKCSAEEAEKHCCALCGRSNGALFPRFILDETGKPRILNKRRVNHFPNQGGSTDQKHSKIQKHSKMPQTPSTAPTHAPNDLNESGDDDSILNASLASESTLNAPSAAQWADGTAATPNSIYTPIHIRSSRSDSRRRGRRGRSATKPGPAAPAPPPDIVWFHDICARSKPRFYQHTIDPTHVEDRDELLIPVSDDEDDFVPPKVELAPNSLPSKPTASSSPRTSLSSEPSKPSDALPKTPKKTAPTSTTTSPNSKSTPHKANAKSPQKEEKKGQEKAKASKKVMAGDRGRNCRVCGGHSGACVVCSEPDCGKHFHPHCAELFGLEIERDEPMQFKCRTHSMPIQFPHTSGKNDYNYLFELLPEEEKQGLYEELASHDSLVVQGKQLTFGASLAPPVTASNTPTGHHTSSPAHHYPGASSRAHSAAYAKSGASPYSKSTSSKSRIQPTPSYAAPRPLLLPLEEPIPQVIFNYWLTKRVGTGYELMPRLRVMKQDELRHQEYVDIVSDMEEGLRKMVLLRQHMERIRILVDLCKKREGLKKQQLDDLADLLELPGLAEHALRGGSASFGGRPPALAYHATHGSTPNKARKLTAHATPSSASAGGRATTISYASPASKSHLHTSATHASYTPRATPNSRQTSTMSASGSANAPRNTVPSASGAHRTPTKASSAASTTSANKKSSGIAATPKGMGSPRMMASPSSASTRPSGSLSHSAKSSSATLPPKNRGTTATAHASSPGAAKQRPTILAAPIPASGPLRAVSPIGPTSVTVVPSNMAYAKATAGRTALVGATTATSAPFNSSPQPARKPVSPAIIATSTVTKPLTTAAQAVPTRSPLKPTAAAGTSLTPTTKIIATRPTTIATNVPSASPSKPVTTPRAKATPAAPRPMQAAPSPPATNSASNKRTYSRITPASAEDEDVDVESISPRAAPTSRPARSPGRATRRSLAQHNMNYDNDEQGFCSIS